MPSPSRKQFRDLPVYASSSWDDVGKARGALNSLEQGIFLTAAQMCDAFGRDDRINGVLSSRVKQLLSLPTVFETPEEDGEEPTEQQLKLCEEVEKQWPSFFPEADVGALLRWGILLGVAVAEIVWERTDARWTPRLKVWHPQFLWYDWNGRVLRMQTADGWVDVVPGDGQWVVFAPSGVERGWMGGAVRALAIPWLIRQWAYRDWARYSEVHGMPTRKALVPQNAPQDQKDAFLNELAALGTEATVVLPQGTDAAGSFNFLLEEAKSNTWEGFQRLIAQVDASIAVTLLGQNLTTEVNAGSRAAAQVHADVKQTILEADAQTLATTLREQALKPWALFNYGDAELAPFPNWKTDPPEDRKANADALSTLATALKTLKDAQINVDAEALLEKAGVVVLDDLPPPPAPKPGKLDRLADVPTPVLEGQLYADDVADAARQLGVNVMSPDLNEVLRQIHLAHDFDDMRTRLVETYRRMDPTTLQRLLERAELLAELDGRYRVSQEK